MDHINIDIERVLRESLIPVDSKCIDDVHQRLFKRPKRLAPDAYEIHEELGRGQFGRVYRSTDKRLPRDVALKVIHYDDGRQLARLEREAHALAKLSHPNIVTVFEKGIADVGIYFLATELVSGTRLDQWMHEPSRGLDEILEIFAQAADGLHHAHQRGLVHRDFKPSNAIVDGSGRLRILDFGLVKLMSERGSVGPEAAITQPLGAVPSVSDAAYPSGELTPSSVWSSGEGAHPDHVLGTPAYASLEQLEGKAVDSRSDQFSLCIALFEACYGFRPFSGRSVVELSEQIAAHEIVRAPSKRAVPRWLKQLLHRGLSPNPADRLEDVAAIASTLRAHLRPRTRSWLGLGLAGGVVLTLGVTLGARALVQPPEITLDWSGAWPETFDRGQLYERYGPDLGERLEAYEAKWQEARDRYAALPTRDPEGLAVACLGAGKQHFHELVERLGEARGDPIDDGPTPPLTRERTWLAHFFDPDDCSDTEPRGETDDAVVDQLLEAQAERLAGHYERALALLEPLGEQPSLQAGLSAGLLGYERGTVLLHLRDPKAWPTLAAAALDNEGDREHVRTTLARQLEAGVVLGLASERELDTLLAQLQSFTDASDPVGLMAQAYADFHRGRFEAARRGYASAGESFAAHAPSRHRSLMIAHTVLHQAYAASNLEPRELDLDALEPALATLRSVLGSTHPRVLDHGTNVARILREESRLDQADRLITSLLSEFDTDSSAPVTHAQLRARSEKLMVDLELHSVNEAARWPSEWSARIEEIETMLTAQSAQLDPAQRRSAFQVREIAFIAYFTVGNYPRAFAALDAMGREAAAVGRQHDTCDYYGQFQLALADEEFQPGGEIEARLRSLCR